MEGRVVNGKETELKGFYGRTTNACHNCIIFMVPQFSISLILPVHMKGMKITSLRVKFYAAVCSPLGEICMGLYPIPVVTVSSNEACAPTRSTDPVSPQKSIVLLLYFGQ